MGRIKSKDELERERVKARRGVHYPVDKLLLVYARQSTKAQVEEHVESAEQAEDLKIYGIEELGWPEENCRCFTENETEDGRIVDASGRLNIDDRPKLQMIMRLIEQGKAGAVLMRKIDRLSRADDLILSLTFAELCKKHNVLLLTSDDVFDFNNPQGDDLNRFTLESIKAKDYNKHHVKGVMLKARTKKALRGEWAGHHVPTGLMLDEGVMVKGKLKHKQYVVNPYWAPIVARLLKRFRELDGDFSQLYKEVAGVAIFPYLPENIHERVGHIALTEIKGSGYTVKSYSGLKALLTNPALIGHMTWTGEVRKKNAHPAVVDESDFWYAFDRLSANDIDGNPQREKREVRYSREPREALLSGTRSNGKATITSTGHKSVYVSQQRTVESDASYAIKDFGDPLREGVFTGSIHVLDLDRVFVEHLLERLERFREMHEYVSEIPEEFVASVGQIIKQTALAMATAVPYRRSIIERWQPDGTEMKTGRIIRDNPYFRMLGMEHQEATKLALVGVPETIEQTKKEIASLKRKYDVNADIMEDSELRENLLERKRLTRQLEALEKKVNEAAATKKDLQDIENDLLEANTLWPKWDTEKRQRFIRLVTQSITFDVIADGWLQLTIQWSPFLGINATDIAILWRQRGTSGVWTNEENALLQEHYPHARRAWLLEQLPRRTWLAIVSQASRLKIKRQYSSSDTDLPAWMSLEDRHVLEAYGLTVDTPAKAYCWWIMANGSDDESSAPMQCDDFDPGRQ